MPTDPHAMPDFLFRGDLEEVEPFVADLIEEERQAAS
jgi:hypothetical protein